MPSPAGLIFAYGTLRRGEPNHHVLAGARRLGPHTTGARYRMFDCGGYPAVTPGGGTAVHGEVFAVDARTLATVDRLEEHPRLYLRALIPTPFGRAWIYLYRGPLRGRPIVGGDWRRASAHPP